MMADYSYLQHVMSIFRRGDNPIYTEEDMLRFGRSLTAKAEEISDARIGRIQALERALEKEKENVRILVEDLQSVTAQRDHWCRVAQKALEDLNGWS